MDIWRKILIIFILIILLYVLLRLLVRRVQILNTPESTLGGIREGLAVYTDSYVNSLQTANTTNISGMNPFSSKSLVKSNGINNPFIATQLKQYCIKSSFNTAYNGTSVSLDMVNYVLSRGCRFLDFEVYWTQATPPPGSSTSASTYQACVGWSLDPYTPSTNLITLRDVFNTIIMNGYATNMSDPIFIQLRPKVEAPNLSKDSTDTIVPDNRASLYSSITNSITPMLDPLRYGGKINNDVRLDELSGLNNTDNNKGKIVIIMDNVNNPEYVKLSPSLNDVVNMDSNSTIMKTYTSTYLRGKKSNNVVPSSDNYSTQGIIGLTQAMPMDGKNQVYGANLDFSEYITKYSCQVTPMLFNSNDAYLVNYEKMFNDAGCAFIPLTKASSSAKETHVKGGMVYP